MIKDKLVKAFIAAGSIICAVGVIAGIKLGYAKTTDETKEYTIDANGNPLRVAVISDLQLPASGKIGSHQYESFEKTLTMLKNKGMDVLIIGGDFTDLGTDEAYGSFKEIYDKVMGDGEKPVPVYVMGNHDYWLAPFVDSFVVATPAKMQKRFTKYTGEYPYSHKIINGYHF